MRTYKSISPAKVLIVFLIIIFVGGYGYLKTRDFSRGPRLEIISPVAYEVFTESMIEVSGVAKNISFISLNDRPIFIDEDGNFKEKLLLYPGYNIIEVSVRDRFEREVTELREVVFRK